MKKVAIEFSFLLSHKINGGAMITWLLEICDILYSLFLFHTLSFELCKVFEESAGGPINPFSPSSLFSCFFSRTLSSQRDPFSSPSLLSMRRSSLSLVDPLFLLLPPPFVARSANRPTERSQRRCSLVTVYLSRQRGAAFEQSEGV